MPDWEAAVPREAAPRPPGAPLLAKAKVQPPRRAVERMFERLARAAALSHAGVDAAALFGAALNHEQARIREAAVAAGAEAAEARGRVAALLPLPFLHACHHRWAASLPGGWTAGYCPLCGAWPASAEVRGVERSRHLRCAECGAGWRARPLLCPYCGTDDHGALGALVPEQRGSTRTIDVCKRCSGYVKVFTTLRGSAPAEVMLDDLASAELDIAALERGYGAPRAAATRWRPGACREPRRFAPRRCAAPCSPRWKPRRAAEGAASAIRRRTP